LLAKNNTIDVQSLGSGTTTVKVGEDDGEDMILNMNEN